MDETWKRFLAAIVLSMVLPRIIVHFGSRIQYRQDSVVPTETFPSTQGSFPTEPSPQLCWIPVLLEDGSVEQMELETYVRGVVLAEMPAYFEEEALKAQAVAARTYALRRLRLADRHGQGAVCTDYACCQAWMSDADYLASRGNQGDWGKVAAAVAATSGLVLTYHGLLAETTYFSCSGGRTEDALAVWGEKIPYLQSVESPGEEHSSEFIQELYFSGSEFSSLLDRELTGSPADWLGQVTYTPGGGVAQQVIGGIPYSGTELRKRLSLNSTAFTMTAGENGITVRVRGNGHRVGMSQYGADAMAATGKKFPEILLYYYQGTEIDKLSDLR